MRSTFIRSLKSLDDWNPETKKNTEKWTDLKETSMKTLQITETKCVKELKQKFGRKFLLYRLNMVSKAIFYNYSLVLVFENQGGCI